MDLTLLICPDAIILPVGWIYGYDRSLRGGGHSLQPLPPGDI